MIRIALAAVGKLDRLWSPIADEYARRLSRYASLEILEAPGLPDPVQPSGEAAVKREEGRRLLVRLKPGDAVIAVTPDGTRMATPEFAARLPRWGERRRVIFLIGGSLGLSDEALAAAEERLSLSDLTFPHMMARVILLEQIYRACRIDAGEPYHK